MEAAPRPPPPQLQDRRTLLQGQTHTEGITLHGEQSKPSTGQLLLVPLTAGTQGAKNPSGSSKLGRGAGGEVPPPHWEYPRALRTPPSSGGMEVTSVHPSKEPTQELIQPPGSGHRKSLDAGLELEVPAASLASRGHSQPSPRARRQRRQQNEVVARSQVVTTKNSTMEFSSKGRQKERGGKKILILPDKGAVRRKGGNSPTEGARGDIGSFPSNSPKEARRAEPITGGQRDPTLFISILPFPAKGRDQIPSGWPLDTASRELLQNYSSRREMQGREPRTHRAPPKPCLDGEKGSSLLPSQGG